MKIKNKPGSKERLLEVMKKVTKEDKITINENVEFEPLVKIQKKEDSQPFGGSKQKYQDGMGYGDEKPVNPELRVKSPELEKFVREEDNESGYDLPVNDDTVVIKINGYPWYLRKAGDSTHFYMSNNPEALNTGAAWASHIGEHRFKSYYDDIRAWLKGGESPNGKEYTDETTMNEYSESENSENVDGEKQLKTNFNQLNSDLEFKKMAQAYGNLLKLAQNKHRAKYVSQIALSSIRDMITDYLNIEKNIPVNTEDVQNFFTNWSKKYSSVMSEEELEIPDDIEAFKKAEKDISKSGEGPFKTDVDFSYLENPYDDEMIAENDEEKKELEPAELDPKDDNNNGDFVEGGLADDANIEQFDPQQIAMGIEVEMEHTKDPKIALEIAMDHLMELPDYYTRLDKMEREGETDTEEDGIEKLPGMDTDEEGNPIPAIDPEFSKMDMEDENTPEEFAADREEMEGEFSNYFDDLEKADDELKNNMLGFDIETPNASEDYDHAAREREYADNDAYKRFLELNAKDFNELPEDEKDEFYELWKEFGKNKK